MKEANAIVAYAATPQNYCAPTNIPVSHSPAITEDFQRPAKCAYTPAPATRATRTANKCKPSMKEIVTGKKLQTIDELVTHTVQNTLPSDPAYIYAFAAEELIREFDIPETGLALFYKLLLRHAQLSQNPCALLPEEGKIPKINKQYKRNQSYEMQLTAALKKHIKRSRAPKLAKDLAFYLLTQTDDGTRYAAVIVYITHRR